MEGPQPERSKPKTSDLEDRYVEQQRERWVGLTDMDFPEKEARAEFQETKNEVRRQEKQHLQKLQRLLTPLVIEYSTEAHAALSPENFDQLLSRLPKPVTIPSVEPLIDYCDAEDVSASEIESKIRELYPHLTDDEIHSLNEFIVRAHRNSAMLTDESLRLGGSRLYREIFDSGLFKNQIRDTHSEEIDNFGLIKDKEAVWGDLYRERSEEVFIDKEILPVGEYGEEFTRRLFSTMQIMLSLVSQVETEAIKLVEENADVFSHTARGRDNYPKGHAAIHALQEGIITFFSGVHLLTAEKIPGFETGEELLQQIIADALPNKLAYTCPAGIIGPLHFVGKHIESLVAVDKNNHLEINPEVKSKMLKMKRDTFMSKVEEYDRSDIYDPELPAVGRGCPVAFKSADHDTTGIIELSQLALTIFNRIESKSGN